MKDIMQAPRLPEFDTHMHQLILSGSKDMCSVFEVGMDMLNRSHRICEDVMQSDSWKQKVPIAEADSNNPFSTRSWSSQLQLPSKLLRKTMPQSRDGTVLFKTRALPITRPRYPKKEKKKKKTKRVKVRGTGIAFALCSMFKDSSSTIR